MITCIALDDEPLALDVIKAFCAKKENIKLVKAFTRASDAFTYLQNFPVDILFLDIQMPDISGIEFYKSLPRNTLVIFTTAHSVYAVEGFNLSAVDYLLKPFPYVRFEQAIEKAAQMLIKHNVFEECLFVRSEYKLIKIKHSEIEYVEGLDDYVKIHLGKGKPVLTRINMKGMMDKLPSALFVRVHRSYIIPLSRLKLLRKKRIYIGDKKIPIGPLYEKNVMHLFGYNSPSSQD
jgi:DNA-binding LytR/AlgR family response regulator